MENAEAQVWRWLSAALRSRGLEVPDGRPLYLYRLTDEEISELKRLLIAAFMTRVDQNSRVVGAALCCWVAHWYQRSYGGGQHVWNAALEEIGTKLESTARTNLIREGLSYLRRELLRINGEWQYLATVMMEGGFPSRMVATHSHWLHRYVEAVVLATGQGDLSMQAASGHAEFYQYLVPPTFCAVHFIELVADLAHRIAGLRKRLADAGITAGAVAWLDRVDPQWRESLPIRTDEDAARHLVEGLVRAKERETALPVGCRRLLVRDVVGVWRFGIRLQIDGELRDDELPPQTKEMLRGYNRARLLASGELARLGFGAVGVASRSGNVEAPRWEIRSLFGPGILNVKAFPTTQDVVLHIAAGPEVLPEFVPSGGARLTSDIVVFGAESKGEDGNLVMIGAGSVSDTRPQLHVAMPAEATIAAENGSEVVDVGLVEGLRLISVVGAAVIEARGERYRIRTGTETAETARLEAIGETLSNAEAAETIFRGTPAFFVHRGLHRTQGDGNSLRVRPSGARRPWSVLRPRDVPVGAIEVGLFEGETCLDRMRLIRLPDRAAVVSVMPNSNACRVSLSDFGEETFELLGAPEDATLSRKPGSSTIDIANVGATARRLKVRARWRESEAVLGIPVLTRNIAFYDADGAAFPERANSSVPGLLGSSVETAARSSVLIGLRSGPIHGKEVERRVERSLPFSQMREDVERLFSMSDHLDAEVTLQAMWYGASVSTINVKRFDFVLNPDRQRSKVTLARGSAEKLRLATGVEVEVVGRPFKDFGSPDRNLEPVDEVDERHWVVPDGEGPWIVYAKIDGIPRSRPVLVHRGLVGDPPSDRLTRALLERDPVAREAMLMAELGRVERGEASETCERIASFVASMHPALPFQSFDILRALPRKLGAAARVAVSCPESVLPRVLDLEARMPLTWCMSRPEAWDVAFGAIRDAYRKVFRDVGADERHADEIVATRAEAICARQPCLAMHLAWTLAKLSVRVGASAPETLRNAVEVAGKERALSPVLKHRLRDLTREAIARNGERKWPVEFSFRRRMHGLATVEFEMSEHCEPVLDAPCCASEIALGRVERTADTEENIRIARSFDPYYFEAAFVVAITLGKGQVAR